MMSVRSALAQMYLILLSQRERAVQREDDPALRVRGVRLAGLQDGGNLSHSAEEQKQVASLLRWVPLVNTLQHTQVWPRVQFLRAGRLLFWRNGLVDHLQNRRNLHCNQFAKTNILKHCIFTVRSAEISPEWGRVCLAPAELVRR